MDTEAKLKQIMDVLDQIAEDTSVPRNIRRGASEAKARLAKKSEALDLRVTSAIMIMDDLVTRRDRKSTRLNSSHGYISYAVFCLKKKKKKKRKKNKEMR